MFYLYTGTRTGTWTLQLNSYSDDVTSIWIGPNALTAVRRDDQSKPPAVDGSTFATPRRSATYSLPPSRFIPIRSFYAQYFGPWFYNAKVIFTPSDGSAPITVVSSTGLASGMVYSQSCTGKTAPQLNF